MQSTGGEGVRQNRIKKIREDLRNFKNTTLKMPVNTGFSEDKFRL